MACFASLPWVPLSGMHALHVSTVGWGAGRAAPLSGFRLPLRGTADIGGVEPCVIDASYLLAHTIWQGTGLVKLPLDYRTTVMVRSQLCFIGRLRSIRAFTCLFTATLTGLMVVMAGVSCRLDLSLLQLCFRLPAGNIGCQHSGAWT